jgi:putative hydrolase of HD superfamily
VPATPFAAPSAPAPEAAARLLGFLHRAERLKDTTRSAWTAGGRHESTAEHSWRLCLLAMLVRPEYPHLDFERVLRMCVVHDLGEAVNGDIPAVDQTPGHAKADAERRDLLTLLGDLTGPARDDIVALWDEYDAASTPEARLVKGLDKLETLAQHTRGANPEGFDYRFNLGYGRAQTDADPLLAALRALVDVDTARRARERQGGAGGDVPSGDGV